MAPKRKRSGLALGESNETPRTEMPPPALRRPTMRRARPSRQGSSIATNPDQNSQVIDGPNALRASPDGDAQSHIAPKEESPLSDVPDDALESPRPARKKATETLIGAAATQTPVKKARQPNRGLGADPEAEDEEEADEEELQEALSRPPPVNSDYLPLPWRGRIGYACLNTYLRQSNPPVFSSRTCRIASILEHRHPLKDPSQPEHPTKNRPDREQPADVRLGLRWVEELGLANARDTIKMLRWNDRYGIKFMRLSSEMFPFASHEEFGYKLAPFASQILEQVGRVVAELGHRVTTHPGQFTQLGSPRKVVVENAIRDLQYHDEMLSLLKLPPQQDRDAVMILHMGGMFGSKPETLDRFRENYARLPRSIKNRLVLENDDVIWTIHDLLPICQELNIPLVLDYHHHNIMFDKERIREGTKDIMNMYPAITETWTRKGIQQKMHYSEPEPKAITGRQRRKHSPRVMTLPPCPSDMDLMIEAKDKEQAVFELMRTFKLPGWNTFNDILPYVRKDDNKNYGRKKATPKKKRAKKTVDIEESVELKEEEEVWIPDEEVGMGGPEGRVYWPPTMEAWLRPKKREVKPKEVTTMPKRVQPQVPKLEVSNAASEDEGGLVLAKPPKKARASASAKRKGLKAGTDPPTPSTSDGEQLRAPTVDEPVPQRAVRSRRGTTVASRSRHLEDEAND